MHRTWLASFLLQLVLAAALAGCHDRSANDSTASDSGQPIVSSPPAVELTVQVAGDVYLAEGVRLLRGEWQARTGGQLKVDSVSLEELLDAEELVSDVIIFPSRHLGTLAERGALRPLRPLMLESPELGLRDIYAAIRNGEMQYGGRTMAFPLGSPPLLIYRQLGEGEAASSGPPWLTPTAGNAAAYALILRGLGYVESYRRGEALFDPSDMTPRIASPPFVRALVELTAGGKRNARDQLPVGFAEAMEQVGAGRAAFTLGWPGAVDEQFAKDDGVAPRDVEFTAIPPAEAVYSASRAAWDRPSNPEGVVLLGVEGRMAGVTASTRNAVASFELARWLTVGDVAVGLSSRSTGTLWYRASQVGASSRWLKGLILAKEGEPVAKLVAEALGSDAAVLVPRIPGIDQYQAALAEAVRTAPADEIAARAVLDGVAQRWEAITDRLGRAKQAAAYRRHLGFDD